MLAFIDRALTTYQLITDLACHLSSEGESATSLGAFAALIAICLCPTTNEDVDAHGENTLQS